MFSKLFMHLKNIPGFKSKRNIVVIESDDWGSIRMPNNETYSKLLNKGIRVDQNNFTRLDTLATYKDLEDLFDVLSSVKDNNNENAKLTPFTCVTNPNFDFLIDNDFDSYKYELFTETLLRYYGSEVFDMWKHGIENNIFVPEYHGREHYNVPLLMAILKDQNTDLIEAVKNHVVHIPIQSKRLESIKSIYPTYFYETSAQIENLSYSLMDGIDVFSRIFSIQPNCFGPPNGVFSKKLEQAFAGTNIKGIVVNRNRVEPSGDGNLTSSNFLFKYGSSNLTGQKYYRRNVKFEPVQSSYSLNQTLSEINAAFKWKKPAIISSHRINYVGSLDSRHKYFALKELKQLLSTVMKAWPETVFLTSGEFIHHMHAEYAES